MEQYDILIIGAGAAGLAAAMGAYQAGCRSMLLLDQKNKPGGILQQCAHRGFGPGLTGPEYIQKLLADFPEGIVCRYNTTVLSVSDRQEALLSCPVDGQTTVRFRQLILATGCLEIPFGALPIAGTRPKGIYTAGQMQEMMNLHGYLPEGPVVILGSGDLGLIMAKQLDDAGIPVAALVEKKPVCGGMARNQRFLASSGIPLLCSCTITQVYGYPRLEGVALSTGDQIPCKTLLIAAGLRPDRSLLYGLNTPQWVQLCGNCSRVHPMVEAVIQEGKQAGRNAAARILKSE